jgi:hypothetical protein
MLTITSVFFGTRILCISVPSRPLIGFERGRLTGFRALGEMWVEQRSCFSFYLGAHVRRTIVTGGYLHPFEQLTMKWQKKSDSRLTVSSSPYKSNRDTEAKQDHRMIEHHHHCSELGQVRNEVYLVHPDA